MAARLSECNDDVDSNDGYVRAGRQQLDLSKTGDTSVAALTGTSALIDTIDVSLRAGLDATFTNVNLDNAIGVTFTAGLDDTPASVTLTDAEVIAPAVANADTCLQNQWAGNGRQ